MIHWNPQIKSEFMLHGNRTEKADSTQTRGVEVSISVYVLGFQELMTGSIRVGV